jgi:hypothetical protein
MQYYNKYIGAIYSRTLALLLWEKRVVNLQILDPGSPRRHGLEIPRTVVAPKWDHLITGHRINQSAKTCIMNAWNERGCGSENFGVRIIEIGFTVEKIWLFEVLGT